MANVTNGTSAVLLSLSLVPGACRWLSMRLVSRRPAMNIYEMRVLYLAVVTRPVCVSRAGSHEVAADFMQVVHAMKPRGMTVELG